MGPNIFSQPSKNENDIVIDAESSTLSDYTLKSVLSEDTDTGCESGSNLGISDNQAIECNTLLLRKKRGNSSGAVPVVVVASKTGSVSRDRIKNHALTNIKRMRSKNKVLETKAKKSETVREHPTIEFSAYLCKLNMEGEGREGINLTLPFINI